MGILSWFIVGGLAGWVANTLARRRELMNLILNIIVGIIGAFSGGFTANLVTRNPAFGFNLQSLFVALLGTVVFLAVLSVFQRR